MCYLFVWTKLNNYVFFRSCPFTRSHAFIKFQGKFNISLKAKKKNTCVWGSTDEKSKVGRSTTTFFFFFFTFPTFPIRKVLLAHAFWSFRGVDYFSLNNNNSGSNWWIFNLFALFIKFLCQIKKKVVGSAQKIRVGRGALNTANFFFLALFCQAQ